MLSLRAWWSLWGGIKHMTENQRPASYLLHVLRKWLHRGPGYLWEAAGLVKMIKTCDGWDGPETTWSNIWQVRSEAPKQANGFPDITPLTAHGLRISMLLSSVIDNHSCKVLFKIIWFDGSEKVHECAFLLKLVQNDSTDWISWA